MRVVPAGEVKKGAWNPINYGEVASLYNAAQINGGVELDRVYNITLFKRTLTRRGLVEGVDFTAANHKSITLVTRLSPKKMTKE